jgi:hypothetical protein
MDATRNDWLGRPLSRNEAPTLPATDDCGLIIALAISTVVGVFGYYGVLVWRFFLD